MTKLDPVEKLSMELAALIAAEEKDVQLIEETEQHVSEIRRERARVIAELRVAAGGQAKVKAERKPRTPQKPQRKARAIVAVPAKPAPSTAPATNDSEKVRNYVRARSGGELLTPEGVSKATGVRTGLVSTYLARMIGEGLLERWPGSKRGRYRTINQAA